MYSNARMYMLYPYIQLTMYYMLYVQLEEMNLPPNFVLGFSIAGVPVKYKRQDRLGPNFNCEQIEKLATL